MLRSLLVFALLCCVTAFAPPASLAVRPAVARAAGPMMKKTGGGGKSGGRNPTKDQVPRSSTARRSSPTSGTKTRSPATAQAAMCGSFTGWFLS